MTHQSMLAAEERKPTLLTRIRIIRHRTSSDPKFGLFLLVLYLVVSVHA